MKTANIDQTLFSALVEAKETRDTGKPAIEDPLGTKLSYNKLITSAQVLGAKLDAAGAGGRERRRDAAELGRRRGDVLCAADDRPRAGDAELHGRRAEHCSPPCKAAQGRA